MRLNTFLFVLAIFIPYNHLVSQSCEDIFIAVETPNDDRQLAIYYDAVVASLEDILSNDCNCTYLERRNFGFLSNIVDNEDYIQGINEQIRIEPINSPIKRAKNIIRIFLNHRTPRIEVSLRLMNLETRTVYVKTELIKPQVFNNATPKKLTKKMTEIVGEWFNCISCKYPITISSGIAGVALTTIGAIKFNQAKKIYDDYEEFLKESDFLAVRPEYESRNDAYNDAEDKRKSTHKYLYPGITFLLGSGIATYFEIKKCRQIKSRGNGYSYFRIKNGFENGYTQIMLSYHF